MSDTFSQNLDYWIHKTKAFLHDPPDKAIHIPGHEERSNDLLAALGLVGSSLSKDEYQQADIIASGMDRACLPGYVAGDDDTKNGAVDFSKSPQITHPTGGNPPLTLTLPDIFASSPAESVNQINSAIQAMLKEDLGDTAGSGKGLSEQVAYKGNEERFAPARFHYLYFLLRRRLARKDIGGLGGLWHRLPADTRLPDHSIWQHSGLVSALASSMRLSEQKTASLMVFALTPVQDFVGRARKLRDYWTGSVLLSWLTFEGIKAVIHRYGADHIVYPSLHGQPLVDGLLRDWGMEAEWFDPAGDKSGVASFPNKFVCLVPTGEEAAIASVIENAIAAAWKQLGDDTLVLLERKVGKKDEYIRQQFARQLTGYWECHWAAAPLVKGSLRQQAEELLHRDTISPVFEFWRDSCKIYRNSDGEGPLYSVSHRLVQAGLAAGKARREDRRGKENGIKCDLFGEFEILHYGDQQDQNPKPSQDPFWQDVRRAFDESDFGQNERLCALGLLKRLASRVVRDQKDHPLHKMFKGADGFPSSTEMAMGGWWRQLQAVAQSQDNPKAVSIAQALAVFEGADPFKKLAQWYHELNESESGKRQGHEITRIEEKEKYAAREIFHLHPVKDVHKYYAVLMMDGDRMGRLINGETLGATWESALHPDLNRRLQGAFEKKYKEFWDKRRPQTRHVSPAVHAAISEALGDFSMLTVPGIIEKNGGHLIYAGGDDVCAVLPAATALTAAREIAAAYGMGFVVAKKGKQAGALGESWLPEPDCKLGVHLGAGKDISISAGIMIAHHKKPLGRVMSRAHDLLNLAKNEGSRNGFALEVDKRSGGGRIFRAQWQEQQDGTTLLDHFLATAIDLQASEQAALSSSLAYRLATFEDGLQALVTNKPAELARFISKQLDRSGLNRNLSDKEKEEKLKATAGHIAALINRPRVARKKESGGKPGSLPLDSLIVANFIGHCLNEHQGGSL